MYTQKRSIRRSPNHNDAGDGPLGRLGVRSFALEHLHKAIQEACIKVNGGPVMVETPFRALFLSEKTRRRDNNGVRVTLELSQILAFNKLSSSKLECIYCFDCSENFCRKRKYCYAVVPSARYAGSELVSLKGFLGHLLLR